jgi:hypothetical protein
MFKFIVLLGLLAPGLAAAQYVHIDPMPRPIIVNPVIPPISTPPIIAPAPPVVVAPPPYVAAEPALKCHAECDDTRLECSHGGNSCPSGCTVMSCEK